MKHLKVLLTSIAISLSLTPTLPAQAANGQITCDGLLKNRYSVVNKRGRRTVYRNRRVVAYRYFYSVRDRNNQRDGRYRRNDSYRRDGRYRRNQNSVICIWNARRDSARLIVR